MFFNQERLHFFKPLSSKYREQIVQCLRVLYQRQYGSNADYGQAPDRDLLLELLQEALARSADKVLDSDSFGDLTSSPSHPGVSSFPPLSDHAQACEHERQRSITTPNSNKDTNGEPSESKRVENHPQDNEQRFKNTREQAAWVLKLLTDCGWIERQVDQATLQSRFPFTRLGRIFAQALIESDTTKIRTRHRNTRNTLNALEAFIARGEIYDLLDAYEYSERIITDFTDVIAELEERKRELVRQVESEQLVHQASDQFFEFMEKRFQPDISVRLSADSVEKHRDDIAKTIAKIRRKGRDFKKQAELKLRTNLPEHAASLAPGQSLLWMILDHIDKRMRDAADIMLPALRRALHGFTKRADIIIRQLSYLNSQHNSDLLDVCRELADLPDADYQARLQHAATSMASVKVQLVDPGQLKVHERKQKQMVDSIVKEQQQLDSTAQRELYIQQMLDQAFTLNNQQLRDYLTAALHAGERIHASQLPVDSAQDLLALAHIIEVASNQRHHSDVTIHVEPTGQRIRDNSYYQLRDEFVISLHSTR